VHDPDLMRAVRLDAKLEAYKEFEQCIDELEKNYKNLLYRRAWKVALYTFKSHILKQLQQRLTQGT
jgi:hypothetical protein